MCQQGARSGRKWVYALFFRQCFGRQRRGRGEAEEERVETEKKTRRVVEPRIVRPSWPVCVNMPFAVTLRCCPSLLASASLTDTCDPGR
ncbi:unnamed protein product [Protopolystoma xenopodis]|uniref:Uncharacterized protein n=1 Tax=Protopolystoma xenopodis TaxID=117903 RepID=A0A3S5AR67_9PLAT|nr:unnamed protein product [Protopolystoma xenopodis]